MNNRENISELFDVYEKLFTTKQIEIFKMYYFENLTFDEIAKELKISKAAVGDSITKTKHALINYEEKLSALKMKKEINRGCKCKI